jgi:hypothetical protein
MAISGNIGMVVLIFIEFLSKTLGYGHGQIKLYPEFFVLCV